MLFKDLVYKVDKVVEDVTTSKFNKYIKIINSNEQYREKLSKIESDEDMDSFIEEVFGEPNGIWKNTKEEQHKLLRRIQQDVIKDKGDADLMRPVFSEI
jgi:hypothetical protein